MTKTRPFLSMCYGDPSATEVPPCCETATKKLTFSTTSVLLLLNMPLSLSRATIFRRQKNPRRVYRPKIAGILFVCNEPEGKYYTVPYYSGGCINHLMYADDLVIVSPSVAGLYKLIHICESFGLSHDVLFNNKKSTIMSFRAGNLKDAQLPLYTYPKR